MAISYITGEAFYLGASNKLLSLTGYEGSRVQKAANWTRSGFDRVLPEGWLSGDTCVHFVAESVAAMAMFEALGAANDALLDGTANTVVFVTLKAAYWTPTVIAGIKWLGGPKVLNTSPA